MQNKITTYLLYAIGEIALVVIGILIAVQIDEWNKARQQQLKELQYLSEIKSSLLLDIENAKNVIAFNNVKTSHILKSFKVFENADNKDSVLLKMGSMLDTLFSFQMLVLERTAFDNMVSAETISIIRNDELRQALSIYYNWDGITQERTKEMSRAFLDMLTPHITTNFLFNTMTGMNLQLDIQSIDLPFYKDPKIIGQMFSMTQNMRIQNELMQSKKKNAKELIKLVNNRLKD
jgi:glutaredoxin-related protein